MSTIPKPSAPTLTARRAESRPLGYSAGASRDRWLRLYRQESNKLEEVEEGGAPSESDVYTKFYDARRDEWELKWLPLLRSTPVPRLLERGVSRATIYAARAGRELYVGTKVKLIAALERVGSAS